MKCERLLPSRLTHKGAKNLLTESYITNVKSLFVQTSSPMKCERPLPSRLTDKGEKNPAYRKLHCQCH